MMTSPEGDAPKGSGLSALAKTKAGQVASLTKPTAEGAKDTTKTVAKAAIKGAATGGWVGAVRGAAVSFAKTKAGRRIIACVLIIILVCALAVPLAVIGSFTLMTSAMAGGDQARSAESVTASGVERKDLGTAASTAQANSIPWPIFLAVQQHGDVDVARLRAALRGLTTLGIGTVYTDNAGMAAGKTDKEKSDAAEERKRYIAALQVYGMDEGTAGSTYDQALAWFMGQAESCTADGEAPPEPTTDPAGSTPPDVAAEPAKDAFVTLTTDDGKTHKFNATQVNNAVAAITAAKKIKGMTDDALTIMLMTALVESGLKNYANSTAPWSLAFPHDAVGHDHDSLNMFQQRLHWAPKDSRDGGAKASEWLMDIPHSVQAFFGGPEGPNKGSPRGLFDVKDWESRPKGEAAQAVQVSAFPDRYAEQESLAKAILARYGGATASGCDSGVDISGAGGHPVGDVKWPVSSGFGSRTGSAIASKIHGGIDFGGSNAFCHMPIYSVSAGTVTQVGRNGNWGNTVTIDHGSFTSLYAHQADGSEKYWPKVGDKVEAGQRIGRIGNTGNSEACHLHFEIHVKGKPVDPAPFLIDKLHIPLVWLSGANGKVPGAVTSPWYVPDLSKKLN